MRTGSLSTPTISDAPIKRAPAVAHNPIGPCANTTTLSPSRIFADSAPLKPVDAMSASRTTCSSVKSSGILARLACALGTRKYSAWAPSMVLPNRHPPYRLIAVVMTALRPLRGKAGATLSAGRDGAHQDSITHRVAGHAVAEIRNHSDWLMTDDQAGFYRVFPPQNMQIRPANGGQSDLDDRFANSRGWSRYLLDPNVVGRMKYSGFHGSDCEFWNHRLTQISADFAEGDQPQRTQKSLLHRNGELRWKFDEASWIPHG